jgi:hypothetical protein
MAETTSENLVKIRAKSPGKYPILVLELPTGDLQTAYYETGYDLESAKTVEEEWLKENAIGRHSFTEIEPPVEVDAGALEDYVRREILGEA